jgi:hypothetical protein
MSLVINTLNSSTISTELQSIEDGIINELFDIQDKKSGAETAQQEVNQPENICIPAHEHLKTDGQVSFGKFTMHIPKPGKLAGISTFDYAELRNYIYGVNGRY